MTYSQVYGDPYSEFVLCIYPSKVRTHTQQWTHTHTPWTHTRSSEQPFMLWRWGAVGGPVPCSRAPRYGIEGGERTFYSLPPPTIPAEPETRTRNPDYESDFLTIRPWLPQYSRYDKYSRYIHKFCLQKQTLLCTYCSGCLENTNVTLSFACIKILTCFIWKNILKLYWLKHLCITLLRNTWKVGSKSFN